MIPCNSSAGFTRCLRQPRRRQPAAQVSLDTNGRHAIPSFVLRGWYNLTIKTANTYPALDQLVAPLGNCLTPESARRLLALKADPRLQARVDDLTGRHSRGELTTEEQAEYGRYVAYSIFVPILKSKARQLLAHARGE